MRWYLTQGAADSWLIPVVSENGSPIPCTGLEPLSALVWPGGQREQSFALIPVWKDFVKGLTLLTIDAPTSALLEPQVYTVECTIIDAVGPRSYYKGWLEINPVADLEPTPPSYCSYQDVLDQAAWIQDLQTSSDQAGFARQRGSARAWLDDIILERYGSGAGSLAGYGYGAGLVTDQGPSQWLRDQLDANRLIVRAKVRDATAKRTLSLLCASQLGKGGEHSYQDLARKYSRESEEIVKTLRVEIDLNSDGISDLTVNLGSTSLR